MGTGQGNGVVLTAMEWVVRCHDPYVMIGMMGLVYGVSVMGGGERDLGGLSGGYAIGKRNIFNKTIDDPFC